MGFYLELECQKCKTINVVGKAPSSVCYPEASPTSEGKETKANRVHEAGEVELLKIILSHIEKGVETINSDKPIQAAYILLRGRDFLRELIQKREGLDRG